jgi:hypothetical protein
MHPEQKRIYKSMTAEQKYEIVHQLYWSAVQAKEAWLRSLHPEWDEKQIRRQVREIFLYART